MQKFHRLQAFRSKRGGFTLVEALIVIAVISIIASIGLPALLHLIHRAKIEGIARQTATLMRKARLEAIKQGVQTVVEINTVTREIRAFADVDGITSLSAADGEYNTVAGDARGETDYIIGTPYLLPNKVDFSVPPDLTDPAPEDRPATFNNPAPVPVAARDFALFQSNGSILNAGAIRFGDGRNNFLEVRVEPAATAQIQVRKWNAAVLNLSAFDSSHWFAPGDEDLPWKWN